jgi:hypothetical protein
MGLEENEIGIQPGPKPPPVAGQKYLAIYPREWRNLIHGVSDSLEGFEEVYGIGMCLTFRFGYSPRDRTGREMTLDKLGLLATARRVMFLVHGNYSLMNLANVEIPDSENKIGEPLAFLNAHVTEKGPDWFGAESGKAVSGYAVDLSFSGGKRLQPLPLS